MTPPQLWIFAGPNGAGKSTIVERFLQDRVRIINPDTIAREMSDRPDGAEKALKAGRLALQQRKLLLESGQSFVIETTLTGKSELELARAASMAGFKVTLIYIGLDDVQISIGRVRERVLRGGHDVPYADLIRRFGRSVGQLGKAMSLAHRVLLFDNSGERQRFVFSSESGRMKFASPRMPRWARSAIEG